MNFFHLQGDKERTISGEATSVSPAICNNGSVNELDVIVDLLGVPSDLLTQRDLNRYSVMLYGLIIIQAIMS